MVLLIGYFSKPGSAALIYGAVFGFMASFLFMVQGYSGTSPLLRRIPVFIIIGVIGGMCGIIGTFIGSYIRLKEKKH